jgi:CNT family concentrative nucleoside transporter
MLRLLSFVGLVVFVAIAWALSEDRRRFSLRLLFWALGLQLIIALLFIRTPLKKPVFAAMAKIVTVLTESTLAGAGFVFGSLATEVPFAFQVLPVIIFVSALSAILYHLRVIPVVVHGVAWLMRRTLRTSGAETLGAALLIFMGIESAAAIRVYLRDMTRSELNTVMTTFMATIAGSVMVIYAGMGAEAGHLLAASLMSAPAAILISKLMVPETQTPRTSGDARVTIDIESRNLIDAAAQGAGVGLNMALNVGAMLIVFLGLIHLCNLLLGAAFDTSFQEVIGWCFMPFAVLMGVAPGEAAEVGQLLGIKTVLNEFLAYQVLSEMIDAGQLSERARTIATYALCGFANPGSMGVAIAGLDALVPERRAEICALSVKSLIGGTLACFMTACIAGILI